MYIVFASAIMILICIIYQGTYSYFLASTENNGNNTTTGGTTKELTDLIITDGVDVTSSNIIPGESVTSTFTVQNQNDIEVCFGLVWTNVTNTFTNTSDLIVTLQKSDGTVLISDTANQIFPTANDEELISGLKISGETTDTYTITITYKNTDQNQIADMNATFSGTITGIMTECPRSITDEIIASVDTTGACPEVLEDGTVNVTSIESENGYICSAPDDYGTSYYFRGNVTNNYVKFAGFYWRILRINGDGSIRMIYVGNANEIDSSGNAAAILANGYDDSTTKYTQIGESAYNSSYNDNAYVGYMYGATGASTYEETHANINNSTIKGVVDEWYRVNIAENEEHPEYAQYISDTLFCNDRSFAPDNTGTGAGTSQTYYRWYSNSIKTLKCSQQNDRFTVDDEVVGNGDLTYPIGLLTIDEVYLAGGSGLSNSGYYLYTGNLYWAMSPRSFDGSNAFVRGVNSSGNAFNNSIVFRSYGVRPVLNLKSGSLTQGSGTVLDPYRV